MERILVGTDASASADAAVEVAAELAEGRGAELLVLYVESLLDAREVFDPRGTPDAKRYLAELRGRLCEIKART
ncbi:MAG: universal stress protein, partial [Actinomycetota bacterium]